MDAAARRQALPDRLPRGVMVALAGPSIPLAALSLPLVVYLPAFYTGTLGLDLATVGSVFMIVRLLDIAFDPFIGGVMDRVETRAGRYRPWLVAAAPIVAVAMAMLFMAPRGVGALYLTWWLLVGYAGWSIMGLAQLALGANVSPDYHERSRIYGWWQIAFSIGMVLSMLMPRLAAMIGATGTADSMAAMAWLVIVLAPATVALTVLIVRERPVAVRRAGGGVQAYLDLLRHATVQKLLACEGLLGLAGGATSTLALFYFTRIKQLDIANLGLLLIGHAVLGLAFAPGWSWLANRIGKHRALGCAALLYQVGMVAILLAPPRQLVAVVAAQGVVGIAFGGATLLPRAMIADISDTERLRTGQERTGLLYALLLGVSKIGQALAVGILFYALALIGFDPAAGGANTAAALAGLQLLYVGLPIILCLLAAWSAFRYPLTAERHAAVRRELDRLNAPYGA